MFAAVPAGHAADDTDGVQLAAVSVRKGTPASRDAVPGGGDAVGDDLPLRLRNERRFNVLGGKKKPVVPEVGIPYPFDPKKNDDYPLFVIAEHLEGRTDDVAVATGDVELHKAGSLFYGDKVIYWPLDDEVDATGNVRMLQEGTEFAGPHVRMKMSEQIGFVEDADYLIVKQVPSRFVSKQKLVPVVTVASSNAVTTSAPMMLRIPDNYGLPTTAPPTRPSLASGTAERAEFEGENQITLFDSTFSTCKPGDRDWYLRASEMHLDYDRDVGSAKNATMWFKDVPIFYLPVATFPLNHERHSGFMHPLLASSSRSGLDLTVPYYWNIAPNYDATFYPRYMSRRGLQLGAEGRYWGFNSGNPADPNAYKAEYMPHDQIADRDRYAYQIKHQQTLGQGVSAAVNYNRVSDSFYWQDTSSRLFQTSQVQLPQQFVLAYTPVPWLQTTTQVLRYQTLQTDPKNPVLPPYFLEPQVNLVGFKPDVLGTDLTLIGQYTRFTHPDAGRLLSDVRPQGDRMVLYPQLSLPIVHPAFTFIPKIGVSATQYSLNNQVAGADSSVSRVLPVFTLDSSVIFERETSLLDNAFIQTLEPRLYYVNIPYKDQTKIPLFDTAQADFNFAQIFSENRYSGFDRINDANQLTAALVTRYLDGNTGAERFKAMVGQRYYFSPSRVTLNYTPLGSTVVPVGNQSQGYSNILAAFSGLVLPKTYADFAVDYNFRDSLSDRVSVGVRFQPELAKVLSASYRYTRNTTTNVAQVDQVDIAGQWPLTNRLYAVGRFNWSFLGKQTVSNTSPGGQLLEAIAGLEYNAGCWTTRIVAQRLAAISGSPNNVLFLQLEFNDFTSIGTDPISLLRRSVPGYGKTNELTSSSLLTTQ
jgi:LPS-assembly protein